MDHSDMTLYDNNKNVKSYFSSAQLLIFLNSAGQTAIISKANWGKNWKLNTWRSSAKLFPC
jgi:hypothetical protein